MFFNVDAEDGKETIFKYDSSIFFLIGAIFLSYRDRRIYLNVCQFLFQCYHCLSITSLTNTEIIMAKAKTKTIIKAAALDKTIDTSTDALNVACSSADSAVTAKTAEAKKLTAEVKRFTKKKTTLTKRNKTAAAKVKKDANAANKKAAASVAKDVKATKSALDKARANKAVVAEELAALKAASKRLTAYTKAISAADKVLNKVAKKKKKKRKTAK